MSNIEITEVINSENIESKYALHVAFQTMKERCQQLQNRLAVVEKENVALRLEYSKSSPSTIVETSKPDDQTLIKKLQEKVEELTKKKSQLTHHVFMVAAENRQLWNRLTRLTQANKSLGNQLTNIMDTLKQHPPMDPSDILSYSFENNSNIKNELTHNCSSSSDSGNKEPSLEEISLKLINSILLEKSELEQQYAEMVELQSSSPLNLQNVGFTYPDDVDANSLEQLKHHEIRLSQTKETLLTQQTRLKKVLQEFKKTKKGTACKCILKNTLKNSCFTQMTSNNRQKESSMTQTGIAAAIDTNECLNSADIQEEEKDVNICPLCGAFFQSSTLFQVFHEHVLSHFSNEVIDGFELVR